MAVEEGGNLTGNVPPGQVMAALGDGNVLERHARLLKGLLEEFRLLEGHQPVGRAVDDQDRRIARVEIREGAGRPGVGLVLGRLLPEPRREDGAGPRPPELREVNRSAVSQKGASAGSSNSRSPALAPISTERMPSFVTARSSSCAAASGS